MDATIKISPTIYELLRRRAREMQSTPEAVAEAALRLQLGHTTHIEQRATPFGPQAYLRDTRVAVRHIAAFLQAGHTAEEIVSAGLPHLPAAAIYEAIAYYYDHQAEVDAELASDTEEAIHAQLRKLLTPEDFAQLTGRAA